MILRVHHLELLKRQLANFPVVAILGARQVGKTTLARQLEDDWDGPKRHFDLEDPDLHRSHAPALHRSHAGAWERFCFFKQNTYFLIMFFLLSSCRLCLFWFIGLS